MTIEFGLVDTDKGLRVYGAGIASSRKELLECLQLNESNYKPFDPVTALRTPYEIDHLQAQYFILNDFTQLLTLDEQEIVTAIKEAMDLGLFANH
jgi:phenylalanine-4-hydroxylase